MTFLYFIEQDHEGKPTKEQLAKLGLSYIVDQYSELVHGATLNDGPGNKRGVVVMRETDGIQPRLYKDKQEWRKIAGRWIGWNKGVDVSSLKPELFQRDSLLDGYQWTDWKGNVWQIPVARKYDLDSDRIQAFNNLPSYLGLNESGEWFVKGVQDKYKMIWDLACRFEINRIEAVEKAKNDGRDTIAFDVGDLTTICDVVFSANYRLSSIELGVMEIMTDETAVEVMQLISDWPGLQELQKKIPQGIGTT